MSALHLYSVSWMIRKKEGQLRWEHCGTMSRLWNIVNTTDNLQIFIWQLYSFVKSLTQALYSRILQTNICRSLSLHSESALSIEQIGCHFQYCDHYWIINWYCTINNGFCKNKKKSHLHGILCLKCSCKINAV